MVSLSTRYSLFKRLLKSRAHVDLHHTEPVPMVAVLLFLPERALRKVASPFSSVMVRMSAPVSVIACCR